MKLIRTIAAACLVANSWGAFAETRYQVIDMGLLPSGDLSTVAFQLNDRDEATGLSSGSASFIPSTFVWDPIRGIRDIPVDAALAPANRYMSAPFGMNDWQQFCGEIEAEPGQLRGFVWGPLRGIHIIEPLPGAIQNSAYDINDLGMVVGLSQYPDDRGARLFVWNAFQGSREIAMPQFDSLLPARINNAGQIVGSVSSISGGRAFVWDVMREYRDLGVLPGMTDSSASGINIRGQVVGTSSSLWGAEAFIWDERRGMRGLGVLAGDTTTFADDINDRGEVVGMSYGPTAARPFIWTARSGMRALEDLVLDSDPLSGRVMFGAVKRINDRGRIVVIGTEDGEVIRSYLLVPHEVAANAPLQ
jgi:probable HAF family extracellular repeat protein